MAGREDGLTGWSLAPSDLELLRADVHVWRVGLDQPGDVVRRVEPVLAPDERARAERYRLDRIRDRFVVGRAALRIILGRYLVAEPARLAFGYGAQGKPALAEPAGGRALQFNVAHSEGLALLAFARDRPLGVDLERIRPMPDAGPIVARFFSARERDEYAGVPEGQKLEAFFRGWTRKEAYMKATGLGLTMPLDRFAVALTPGRPPELRHVEGQPEEPARWSFVDLDPAPGYLGALAVEGADWSVARFEARLA